MSEPAARTDFSKSVALWAAILLTIGAGPHLIGSFLGRVIGLSMLGGTQFARDAVVAIEAYRSWYMVITFSAVSAGYVLYWSPVVAWMRRAAPRGTAPPGLVRRVLGGPVLTSILVFLPWALSILVFPGLTVVEMGRWSGELFSRQIATPLISGLLATTITFLLHDSIVRRVVLPALGDVRPSRVEGVRSLGIAPRLVILVFAVGFAPFFTMVGLIDAAERSLAAGVPIADVFSSLVNSSSWIALTYVLIGAVLTVLFAYTLVRPLRATTQGLLAVRSGALDARVLVESNDEIGALGDSVNELASTLRERAHILGTFGRIVEPRVRDRLLEAGEGQGGERRRVTVLFLDLAGYTTMAEAEAPEDTVRTLNEFFETMSEWVHECGGFIDKFVGDAMLVCFGLFDDASGRPVGAGEQARAAVRAAAGIRERLQRLNSERSEERRSLLSVGMGIHSGDVVAGIVGAKERHEYTVIGDAVNVAARLQEACRERGVDVLASRTVRDAMDEPGGNESLQALGSMQLRGRSTSLDVYTLSESA
jgi:adenylate cyclase